MYLKNQKYNLINTYIESTYKEGIVIFQYELSIKFREKDKLRRNYQVNIITNSYK